MEECKFCAIAEHAIPALPVFEDEDFLIFLDAKPLFLGHCLVIPKQHYPSLNEIPANLLGPLFTLVQKLGGTMQKALPAEGFFVAINTQVSQSVPHLHVHVVPRNQGDGLKGFFWPRHKYASAEEAQKIQKLLKNALTR